MPNLDLVGVSLAVFALAGCGPPTASVGYQLASTTDYGGGQGLSIGFGEWRVGEAEYSILVMEDGTYLHTVGTCGFLDFGGGDRASLACALGGMLQSHSDGGWGWGPRAGIGMRFEGKRADASLLIEGALWIGSDGSKFAAGAEARLRASASFAY